jgi:hypothetical protein
MQTVAVPDNRTLELELIAVALRYVAVADWFESRSVGRADQQKEAEAMDAFNQVESALRKSGGRLLRRLGQRQRVLASALEEAWG